jgi:hypothetical protein
MKKIWKYYLVSLIIDSSPNIWKEKYFKEEINLHEFLKRDQLSNIFEWVILSKYIIECILICFDEKRFNKNIFIDKNE